VSRAAFDAADPVALERFFADLPTPIDHGRVGGTGGKRPGVGLTNHRVPSTALRSLVENVARDIAPFRVNLIATRSFDTPLSASVLGDSSTRGARSSAPDCRSGVWSGPTTSPHSPCT
jgi:hypothetical protein